MPRLPFTHGHDVDIRGIIILMGALADALRSGCRISKPTSNVASIMGVAPREEESSPAARAASRGVGSRENSTSSEEIPDQMNFGGARPQTRR